MSPAQHHHCQRLQARTTARCHHQLGQPCRSPHAERGRVRSTSASGESGAQRHCLGGRGGSQCHHAGATQGLRAADGLLECARQAAQGGEGRGNPDATRSPRLAHPQREAAGQRAVRPDGEPRTSRAWALEDGGRTRGGLETASRADRARSRLSLGPTCLPRNARINHVD